MARRRRSPAIYAFSGRFHFNVLCSMPITSDDDWQTASGRRVLRRRRHKACRGTAAARKPVADKHSSWRYLGIYQWVPNRGWSSRHKTSLHTHSVRVGEFYSRFAVRPSGRFLRSHWPTKCTQTARALHRLLSVARRIRLARCDYERATPHCFRDTTFTYDGNTWRRTALMMSWRYFIAGGDSACDAVFMKTCRAAMAR